jgi:hypothetical protein
MATVAPGSDAFMTLINKMGSREGITAIPMGEGFRLSLIEAHDRDARNLKTTAFQLAASATDVADKLKELVGADRVDSIPVFLQENVNGQNQRWVLVDPADMQPRPVAGGIVEREFRLI